MGKILIFLFDGVTDYEITLVTHLLKADAGMDVITAIGSAFVEFAIEICDGFGLFGDDEEKESFARMYGVV